MLKSTDNLRTWSVNSDLQSFLYSNEDESEESSEVFTLNAVNWLNKECGINIYPFCSTEDGKTEWKIEIVDSSKTFNFFNQLSISRHLLKSFCSRLIIHLKLPFDNNLIRSLQNSVKALFNTNSDQDINSFSNVESFFNDLLVLLTVLNVLKDLQINADNSYKSIDTTIKSLKQVLIKYKQPNLHTIILNLLIYIKNPHTRLAIYREIFVFCIHNHHTTCFQPVETEACVDHLYNFCCKCPNSLQLYLSNLYFLIDKLKSRDYSKFLKFVFKSGFKNLCTYLETNKDKTFKELALIGQNKFSLFRIICLLYRFHLIYQQNPQVSAEFTSSISLSLISAKQKAPLLNEMQKHEGFYSDISNLAMLCVYFDKKKNLKSQSLEFARILKLVCDDISLFAQLYFKKYLDYITSNHAFYPIDTSVNSEEYAYIKKMASNEDHILILNQIIETKF